MIRDLERTDDPTRTQAWEVGPIKKPTIIIPPVKVFTQLGVMRIRSLGMNPPCIFTFVSNKMVISHFAVPEAGDYDRLTAWRAAMLEQPLFYNMQPGHDLLMSLLYVHKPGGGSVMRGYAWSCAMFPDPLA